MGFGTIMRTDMSNLPMKVRSLSNSKVSQSSDIQNTPLLMVEIINT